jgi:hypothetical protein
MIIFYLFEKFGLKAKYNRLYFKKMGTLQAKISDL